MFTSKIGKQPIKSILILSILWIQVFVPVHTSCRITHRSTSAAKDDLRVNSIKSVSPTDWNGGKFESKYTPKSESQAVVDEIGLTEPKSHAPAQSFISEQQKYREYAMEMDNFRVEYNKYKILSHLDITENPNDINPVIDDETRNRLISLEIEREQEANRKLSEKNNNMVSISLDLIITHNMETNFGTNSSPYSAIDVQCSARMFKKVRMFAV